MYIRKIHSRKSTCFQIGQKINKKFVLKKHIGCTSLVDQIEILKTKAKNELNRIKFENQISLFPNFSSIIRTKLINWRITGFHQIFGHIYDSIGFPNNYLRDLTVARIVYPKSKLATIRYLDQYLGIKLTRGKIYRFLDTLNKDKLTKICQVPIF